MDRGNTSPNSIDDLNWRDRSEYWRTFRPATRGAPKKFRYREPVILCGHAIRIRIDHNTLLIRNGFSHFPQKAEQFRFFPGDPNLPDRIIILDANGSVSIDSLAWMSDQKIAFVQLDWKGRVQFSGNSGFQADPKLVKWQIGIQNSKKALQLNRNLIAAKFDACTDTLRAVFGNSLTAKDAISKINLWKMKLMNSVGANSHGQILGYEGMAASIYYRTWHDLPLKWVGLWKKPIPVAWSKVGARSMAWQRESNNARHPINAMLNYGYALLISEMHSELVAVGFDPSIGFAHKRAGNSIPLVYDLIEPMRPIVDKKILKFALASTFCPGDFAISNKGGCRLNPELARCVATHVAAVGAKNVVKAFIENI